MADDPDNGERTDVSNGNPLASEAIAVSSSYKVLGELTAADGIGVLGQNNAGSGTPIGVQGVVPNTTDGYGLYTPDDAKIDGELVTSTVSSTAGTPLTVNTDGSSRTLELGVPTSDGSRTAGGNVVAGHPDNAVNNSAVGVVIGGGGNDAGDNNSVGGDYATVGGGRGNHATDIDATVSGGFGNSASSGATVGGGIFNGASGGNATVSGGRGNTASGVNAAVPGGRGNTASGGYSFAAGRAAEALNDGSFVWSDSGSSTFSSTATDQFLVDAAGGMGVGTDSPSTQLDVNGDANVSGSQSIGKTSLVVFLSTSQTISGGRTRTRVEFDTVDTDHFGGWNGTNFRYEVQEPGDYHVDCHINWHTQFTSEDRTELWVTRNGVDRIKTQAVSYYTLVGNKTFTGMSSGDTIAADVAQSSSSSQDLRGIEPATFLNITKIG